MHLKILNGALRFLLGALCIFSGFAAVMAMGRRKAGEPDLADGAGTIFAITLGALAIVYSIDILIEVVGRGPEATAAAIRAAAQAAKKGPPE